MAKSLLICDEDRTHACALAAGMTELGWLVDVVRSYADAFARACAYDFDVLVVAPFLRDGSALALPSALGICRPPIVVLSCAMDERLDPDVVRRVGFDAQLTKVVSPRDVVGLVRVPVAAALSGLTATKSR